MNRLFLLSLLFFVGCDDVKEFVHPTTPPAMTIDVICDVAGNGGTGGCTSESLASLLGAITPSMPAGSVVRLHGMTDDVAESSQLASFTITAPKKRTVRAVAGHRRRQTTAITTAFLAAAAPVLNNEDRRQSPIAETIAMVILAGNPTGGLRELYVVSDGRQVSKRSPALGRTDFECTHPIPTGPEFAQRLRALLPASSWSGIVIHFRFAKLEPVSKRRCVASVERYTALRTTWTESLSELGARVTWSMN